MGPSGSGDWWLLIPLGQQQQGRVGFYRVPDPQPSRGLSQPHIQPHTPLTYCENPVSREPEAPPRHFELSSKLAWVLSPCFIDPLRPVVRG